MKAVQFSEHGSPDVLCWVDIPDPVIDQDSVLIRIEAAALNHLDLWVRRGIPGVPRPMIPGSDGAGHVAAVGDAVTHLQVGDRVVIQPLLSCGTCPACKRGEENLCPDFGIVGETAPGTNCELMAIPAQYVYPIPDSMDFNTAAAFPLVGETAWTMLINRARIQDQEWVFIWGASSGIGHMAIQIAKHFGCKVITTAGDVAKMEKAENLGADFVLNYKKDDIRKTVRGITNGRGVDVVFEHVGRKTWETSTRILAFGGRIVTCGATTGPKVEIDLRHLFMKQQSLLGSTMGSVASFKAVFDLVKKGIIQPFIDRTFPMVDVRSAHHYMESGKQFGKVLLIP